LLRVGVGVGVRVRVRVRARVRVRGRVRGRGTCPALVRRAVASKSAGPGVTPLRAVISQLVRVRVRGWLGLGVG
jgi:hypothetical protein